MIKKITKTSMVREIRDMLKKNGIGVGGCYNINMAINPDREIAWVSTTQVLIRNHVDGALWKLERQPLYSKETPMEILMIIRSKMVLDLKERDV
jgi:hypothetical protein